MCFVRSNSKSFTYLLIVTNMNLAVIRNSVGLQGAYISFGDSLGEGADGQVRTSDLVEIEPHEPSARTLLH